MISVSVIIPVFNAAPYLHSCINSLLEQTIEDCEFIFVDDGSTDGSSCILEDFQKTDSRIVLVSQENKGVSAARNAGITLAKGSYIGFVDADDTVDKTFLERLLSKALLFDLDVVVSNFVTQIGTQFVTSKSFFATDVLYDEGFIRDTLIPFCIRQDDFNSTCNKLYKREIIHHYQIHFTEGISNGEDALFNLEVLLRVKRLFFIDYAGYYYREVSGSATRNCISKDFFQKALAVYQFDYKSRYDLVIEPSELELLKSIRFVNTIVSLIHQCFQEQEVSFWSKYRYVKKMIYHPVLQDVLSKYWDVLLHDKNRYSRFILKQIQSQSIWYLVLAIYYSNYRNKK